MTVVADVFAIVDAVVADDDDDGDVNCVATRDDE